MNKGLEKGPLFLFSAKGERKFALSLSMAEDRYGNSVWKERKITGKAIGYTNKHICYTDYAIRAGIIRTMHSCFVFAKRILDLRKEKKVPFCGSFKEVARNRVLFFVYKIRHRPKNRA